MLKLTATRHDTGNCRLYCTDQNGNKFVLVDLGSSSNPLYWPHSHSQCGEPDSPVKEGLDWVLEENQFSEKDFYVGLSNRINSIDEFEHLCAEKHNATFAHNSKYCELLKQTDKIKFQTKFKQAINLEKRCEYVSSFL